MALDYFSASDAYFWQWEENGTVIGIPNGNTIAYSTYVEEVLQFIQPSGSPPFGTLLLTILSSNRAGKADLASIKPLFSDILSQEAASLIEQAFHFLGTVTMLPEPYKMGKIRLLLFQCLFENCHNRNNAENTEQILAQFTALKTEEHFFATKLENRAQKAFGDLKTLSVLDKQFPDMESILRKMRRLPELELLLTQFQDGIAPQAKESTVELLLKNPKTRNLSKLTKQLWGGLNIPMHSELPSQMPLGGISDLSNKGSFDKLLISEFAHDDLIFLSRLANNEALFLEREIPPSREKRARTILIDTSLRNWGYPKLLGYAIGLAIGNHPKTDIPCTYYAVGARCTKLNLDSVQEIITSMDVLDPSLHATAGLAHFFKQFPTADNDEIIFVTEQSTLTYPEIAEAMSRYRSAIKYLILTQRNGTIDIFRNQTNTRHHLQQLKIELLKDKEKKAKVVTEFANKIPILTVNTQIIAKIATTDDGGIFVANNKKILFQVAYTTELNGNKAWLLIDADLPFTPKNMAAGLLPNGQHIVAMCDDMAPFCLIINIATKEKTTIELPISDGPVYLLYFKKNRFFMQKKGVLPFSIDVSTKNIDRSAVIDTYFFAEIQKKETRLRQQFTNRESALYRVKQVYIDGFHFLGLNQHFLANNLHFMVSMAKVKHAEAQPVSESEFHFADGSIVSIHKAGFMQLKSSNPALPLIFISLCLSKSLAAATNAYFTGNKFFYRPAFYELHITANPSQIKMMQSVLKIWKLEAMAPSDEQTEAWVIRFLTASKAEEIVDKLAIHNIKASTKKSLNYPWYEQEILTESAFYDKFIQPFIDTILNYGNTN